MRLILMGWMFLAGCGALDPHREEIAMRADQDARLDEAQQLIDKGQNEAVLPILERLLAGDPPVLSSRLNWQQCRMLRLQAASLESLGRFEEAMSAYRRLSVGDPGRPWKEQVARIATLKATKAIAAADAALQAAPESLAALRLHAKACAEHVDGSDAITDAGLADCQKIAQRTTPTGADEAVLARLYWRKNQMPLAMEHAASAVALDSRCGWEPYYFLARGADLLGGSAKAEDLYGRSLALADKQVGTAEVYAAAARSRLVVYERGNDPRCLAAASAACEAWTEVGWDEPRAWLKLGFVRLLQRRWEDAVVCGGNADALDPRSADSQFVIGTACYEQWKLLSDADPKKGEGLARRAVLAYQEAWQRGDGETIDTGYLNSPRSAAPGKWGTTHLQVAGHLLEMLNTYPQGAFHERGTGEANDNAALVIGLAGFVRQVDPYFILNIQASRSALSLAAYEERESRRRIEESRAAKESWAQRDLAERRRLQAEYVAELDAGAERRAEFAPDPYVARLSAEMWRLSAENDRVGAALSQQMRDEARRNAFKHDLERAFARR